MPRNLYKYEGDQDWCMDKLTGEAGFLYEQAQTARAEYRDDDAAEILAMVAKLHPEDNNIKVELARAYMDTDKTGK